MSLTAKFMNLHFKNLRQWGTVRRKLDRQVRWNSIFIENLDPAGLQVQMFTLDKPAAEESKHNLQELLNFCKTMEIPVLVGKANHFQLLGHHYQIPETDLLSESCREQIAGEELSYYRPRWTHFCSETGHWCQQFYGFGENLWLRSPEIGFYDVESGNKITNRKQQIEMLWSLGFVSRRGRPVSAADESSCGSPSDVIAISKLAGQMHKKTFKSDIAKRIVSVYKSTHRYYCWPNHW